METPPAIPPAKPPLGRQFYILLLAPLALMAISFCCINKSNVAGPLVILTGLATFVCSILLARLMAQRMGPAGQASVGMGILMFFAIQAFYGVCFFVGCATALAMA